MHPPDLDRYTDKAPISVDTEYLENVFDKLCNENGIPLELRDDYIVYCLATIRKFAESILVPNTPFNEYYIDVLGSDETLEQLEEIIRNAMNTTEPGKNVLVSNNNQVPIPPFFSESGTAEPFWALSPKPNSNKIAKQLELTIDTLDGLWIFLGPFLAKLKKFAEPTHADRADAVSIFGTDSYEVRYSRAMVDLQRGTIAGLISLASVKPGGSNDIASSPIDPALQQAASNTLRALLQRGYSYDILKNAHGNDKVGDLPDKPPIAEA